MFRRRRLLTGNNVGSTDARSFAVQLQSSLLPSRAAGSATPTFTRATTKYVWGYLTTIAAGPSLILLDAGEAGFTGARRISSGVWSTQDSNGIALTTTNGASALYGDASGPFGYNSEGARTNVLLQSQTLGTTWTISNAADMNAVSADQYVAPDGTTTMDLLQPKNTTAVHSLNQAFTFTAAVYTTSMYLRYVPATPQRWVALVMNDGTTTWAASFDLLNGTAGATSNATSTISATGIANVYRVTVTKSANAAAAAGTVKISLNATDTASLESAARAGTETLGAWGAQLEAGAFASSYIPTTTIAVTRNADVLTYPNAGNISDTEGSGYAEYVTNFDQGGNNARVLGLVSNNAGVIILSSLTPRIYDGTTFAASGLSNVTLGVVTKGAGKWSATATTMKEFASGVAGSSHAFDGSMGATAIYISADVQLFGTIRNVRIYSRALSDAQLQAMTT